MLHEPLRAVGGQSALLHAVQLCRSKNKAHMQIRDVLAPKNGCSCL